MSIRVHSRPLWDFFTAAMATALLILASGCGGPIPKTHYYVIDLPSVAPRPREPVPYTVVVSPFRAPDQLEQDHILYRPSPQELDFYEYHRWAERPNSMLTAALVARLRAQRLFADVFEFDGRAKADYLVRGRVERLEEVDSPNGVTARVDLAVDVVEMKSNRAVWSSAASHSNPVSGHEVRDVVTEMSRSVDACLGQITAGLEQFAKSLPPAPARASAGSP